MATKIADAFVQVTANIADFNKKMSTVQSRLQSASKKMKQVGRRMSIGLTAPIAAIGVVSVRSFAKFDDAMRNVNVIAKVSEKELAAMSSTVMSLSKEMGKPPTDLAEALYNINSASIVGADGLDVLRAATEAGRAGVTDTATSAKAITNILNAYGLEASEAGDVSDVLFKTVEKGVLTFGELAENMGAATATGAAAKVNFDEIAAAAATLTRGGIKTTEAFTSLNRLMLTFIKPTKELETLFASTAEGTGANIIQSRGLGGAMQFLIDKTGGAASGFTELGINIRALKAAFGLARNGGADFAGDLAVIATREGRAGATADALAEQMKGLGFALDRAKAALSVMGLQIGKALAPAVRKLADGIAFVTTWFDNLSDGGKKTVVIIAAIVAAIGPLLLILGLIVPLIAAGVAAFSTLLPIIPIIIGVGAAVVALVKYWEDLKFGVMVVVNEIMGRMTAAGAVIQTFSANTKAAFDFITKGQIPKFKSLSKAWEKEIGIMNKTSQMMFEERWASEEKSQTVAEETSAVVEAASNQATDAQTTNAKKVKKANDKAKGSFTGFADAVKSAQRFASEGFAASAKSVAAGTATGGSTNAGEVKISSDSVSALTKDSGTAEQQRKAMIESLGEIVDLTKRSAVFA